MQRVRVTARRLALRLGARAPGGGEEGTVAIIAAFCLVALMGMLALTVDIGYGYGQRRMAQNVADSGALAGAQLIGEKLLGAPRSDGDVLTAIRDAAKNSTGGFFSAGSDYFTAYYVGGTYDANGNGVPQDLSPVVQVGTGTIPAGARGVRLLPRKVNPTFFARAIGSPSLTASAGATALALDVVGYGDWAPYAIWAGEDTPAKGGTPALREHVCHQGSNPYDQSQPPLTYGDLTPPTVDSSSGQQDYVYGYIPFYNGTSTTNSLSPGEQSGLQASCWVGPGQTKPSNCAPTQVIYYSSSYQNRNVKNGSGADDTYGVTRWNINNSKFKGFFHTSNQYLNIGGIAAFDTGGGYDQGASDLQKLHDCWAQPTCYMVMPVVRYATGGSTIFFTIAGFLPVHLLTDPYASGTGNDLYAEITTAVLSATRNVKTGPCPQNGVPCMKVTRLVQ